MPVTQKLVVDPVCTILERNGIIDKHPSERLRANVGSQERGERYSILPPD
jgi:hypothetical protein